MTFVWLSGAVLCATGLLLWVDAWSEDRTLARRLLSIGLCSACLYVGILLMDISLTPENVLAAASLFLWVLLPVFAFWGSFRWIRGRHPTMSLDWVVVLCFLTAFLTFVLWGHGVAT